MKRRVFNCLLAVALAIGLASCATRNEVPPIYYAAPEPGYTSAPSLLEPSWPRVLVRGSNSYTFYQPQFDSWDGHQLMARDAVAVQTPGMARPTVGVVSLSATTLVNKTTRRVTLVDIHLLNADFPSASQQASSFLESIRAAFPQQIQSLALDHFEACFAESSAQFNRSERPLNNTPPKVIVSTRPAILVSIDGSPAYRPVPGTSLERVLNSGWLLLKDQAGHFYLQLPDGYLEATNLDGPWTVAAAPPKGAAEAERQAEVGKTPMELRVGVTDSTTHRPPPLSQTNAPAVYISTTPAELLLFQGQPDFVPIAGTHLLYAANTTGNVFKSLSDQQTYVLLSGRWFRSGSFAGPWHFVAADHLRVDFANIPDSSPKENVKASVAGTPQATEALIANSIPESTRIARNTAMAAPQVDGSPKLTPIAGTSLSYVANSATPIIEVDQNSWYACQNGVWFTAPSVNGPWTVAAYVPAAIYSIPPDSPLHYLTYVQVYGSTPQEVYEGYTPGYLGTEEQDGVVVYGTGYDYPPWVGDVWFGWPCTWGFGWGPCWTPWDDWCFDFGFGWGCGYGRYGWWHCHPPRPWWGPGRDWGHGRGAFAWRRGDSANTAGNLYAKRAMGGGATVASGGTGYGRAYNSRTGGLVAGQRASFSRLDGNFQTHTEGSAFGDQGWPGPHSVTAQYGPKSPFWSGHGSMTHGQDRSGFLGSDRTSHWSGHAEAGWRGGGVGRGGVGSSHGWGGGGGGGHGGGR